MGGLQPPMYLYVYVNCACWLLFGLMVLCYKIEKQSYINTACESMTDWKSELHDLRLLCFWSTIVLFPSLGCLISKFNIMISKLDVLRL